MPGTSKPLPKRKKAPARKTLAIDFDGVIHNPANHQPYPGTLEYMDILTRRFDVIIFSARATTPAGEEYIRHFLDYHMISVKDVTVVKPMADLYIDDKAVHHTDWDSTIGKISQRLNLPINII